MGAGLALEFKLRYPHMYTRYVQHCREGLLTIGKLWLYKTPSNEGPKWVLNFPTKDHWKNPSKEWYLRAGLENFVETYRERGIESIAFPTLGSQNGGIPEATSIKIMREYLECIEIDVEIYQYDGSKEDDLHSELRAILAQKSDLEFASEAGLRLQVVSSLRQATQDLNSKTISQLVKHKGIDEKTLAKVFAILNEEKNNIG